MKKNPVFEDAERLTEAVNRRKTDNTTANRKKDNTTANRKKDKKRQYTENKLIKDPFLQFCDVFP